MIKKYAHFIIPIIILLCFFGYKLSLSSGITMNELAGLINGEQEGDHFYVDVREIHEFNEAHECSFK